MKLKDGQELTIEGKDLVEALQYGATRYVLCLNHDKRSFKKKMIADNPPLRRSEECRVSADGSRSSK